jgi:HPt (histidine-containing phosphotransfer) domain-containing protein
MKDRLDIEHLKTYINANDALIIKLLTSFANNVPMQLQELKQLVLDNNTHDTAELAHKLKTPFLYFGLDNISERLENIEQNIANLDSVFLLQEVDSIIAIANECGIQAQKEIDRLS